MEYLGTATYSPEDNKLRFYPRARLSPEDYARIKSAGFIWAPKQELFVAPMWTPEREDLLTEWCGEIGDEDTSLVERAEERADRFTDYSAARQEDAEQARAAVSAIADNIPLGQPILVGHHSEKHARKDAEKIENGMRRAVKMWEQSKYWTDRAAGAIAHAKYKERPDVRARRIKTIEADIRRMQAAYTPVKGSPTILQHRWNDYHEESPKIPHVFCGQGRGGRWVPVEDLPRIEASYQRAIAHCERRLLYERAMLDEAGGLVAQKQEIEVGGRVLSRGEWVTVLRVNRKNGAICSVRTTARYCSLISAEDIKGYEPPSAEDAQATKDAMSKAPLCNYPGERFATMTQAQWDAAPKDYKGSREVKATETTARHRVRICIGHRCTLPTPTAEEQAASYCSANRSHTYWPVFITDAKRKDPPAVEATPKAQGLPEHLRGSRADLATLERRAAAAEQRQQPDPQAEEFEKLKQAAKAGVHLVTAPQLFPTPRELAARMAREAGNCLAGLRVLEPSAGTGELIRAAINNATGLDTGLRITAVEHNYNLAKMLEQQRDKTVYANAENFRVVNADFLQCNPNHVGAETLGLFDVVLMNPPFQNGDDIKHIKHALTFLKPGGRLVAICANGPRQNEQLKPLAEDSGGWWEELPADTFKEQGTGVRTALLVIEKAEEDEPEAEPITTQQQPQETGLQAQGSLF